LIIRAYIYVAFIIIAMKYQCIIIDDEPHAVEQIKDLVELMPNLKLVKTYTNPLLALTDISAYKHPVDLILMDIEMPITGIELFEQIKHKTHKLVFVTAWMGNYYEPATKALPDACLLKPVTLERFAPVINKLFPAPKPPAEEDFLFVKCRNDAVYSKINYKDIVAIESKQHYVMIYIAGERVPANISLGEMKNKLSTSREHFLQIHRSFIIGTGHITTVDGNKVTLVNKLDIIVGGNYRKDFTTFLAARSV